jgi:urease accessory protein
MINDGRFPSGGHAHSGGLEPAIGAGLVRSAADLEIWLRGRLHTLGRVDAAFASVAWSLAASAGSLPENGARWDRLVGEYWARTPSSAWRAASRSQARGLVRALRASWPSRALDQLLASLPAVPPWPVVFGVGARGCGLAPLETSVSVATASIQGPAWAATRLLSMDPFAVTACLARLSPEVDEVAAESVGYGDLPGDPADLPAVTAPLLDMGAERHLTWEVRLFAS